MFWESLSLEFSLNRTVIVVLAVLALGSFDLFERVRHHRTHYVFAATFGTILSVGLINVSRLFLQPGTESNPFAMALGVLLVFLGWKALFGPWNAATKATVLGTFLFWIAVSLFSDDTPDQRIVRTVAATLAFIPAVIWCALFLRYHRERLSRVFLMFFSGMISTVPILYYDALVRHGVELQFFLFKITPESFSRNSQSFVTGQLSAIQGVKSVLLTSLVSFLLVGLIEECSKYWVLSHSGKRFFSSIDEVLQMAIIVAIGFAFAENVINPVYFTGFVQDLIGSTTVQNWTAFFGNLLGRSVLTGMVHILSTGVCGYFLGLSIFASPILREQIARGKTHRFLAFLHRLLGVNEVHVFRVQMLTIGLLTAIVLHGVFNFLVTLPDLLPGNPQSLGGLLQSAEGSLLYRVPLILFPAMFYVVGGFAILTHLFLRADNQRERGHLVEQEVFVQSFEES